MAKKDESKSKSRVKARAQGKKPPGESNRRAARFIETRKRELLREKIERDEALLGTEDLRARYQDLFELAPVGYLLVDDEFVIQSVNHTAARMLGRDKVHLVSKPLPGFAARESQDRLFLFLRALINKGREASCEIELVDAGRKPFTARLEGVPVLRKERRPAGARISFTDVTAEVEAVRTLAESEARYRTVTEMTSDYIYSVKAGAGQPTLEWVTGRFTEITGYTPADMRDVTAGWSALTHPDDRDRLERFARETLSGRAGAGEFRIVTKGGETKWVQLTHKPRYGDDGRKVTGFLAAARDITERKGAEAALLQGKLETETLFEGARAVLARERFEDAAQAVYYECKKAVGAEAGFIDLLDPDRKHHRIVFMDAGGAECRVPLDQPLPVRGLPKKVYREQKAAYVNDFPSSRHARYLPLTHIPIANALFAPMMVEGKPLGLFALGNKPGGFTAGDAVLAEAFANLAAIALHKAMSREEIHKHREHLEELVDARTHELRAVNRELRKESEHRGRAERELEAQRALAVRADRLRSLGQMAAGIAHELNQPLMGIRNMAEHLVIGIKKGWAVPPELVSEKAGAIVEQVDRMSHVIEHSREFARGGSEEVGRKPVSVNDAVGDALTLVRTQLKSRGIELRLELAPDLPWTMINPYSLEEVVLNLINNARDALAGPREKGDGPAEGVIIVRTSPAPDGGREAVRLEVSDNGPGMSQDVLGKAFEPFYSTKAPGKGTGLGLSICRSIVERSEGRIEVTTAPGAGTTVSVWLPAAGAAGSRSES